MNNNFRQKTKNLFKREGFYMGLVACLLIVGVLAAVSVNRKSAQIANNAKNIQKEIAASKKSEDANTAKGTNNDKIEVKENTIEKTEKTVEEKTTGNVDQNTSNKVSSEANSVAEKNTSSETAKKTEEVKEVTEEAKSVSSIAATNFINPTDGVIVSPFTTQTRLSKTIGTYKISNGIAIKAEKGSEVIAVSDGKIIEINDDKTEIGQYIVIDHGNGFQTIYGNLSPEIKLKKDDVVSRGMVIGVIGETRGNYLKEDYGSHLYFSVKKDNEYVDPTKYITNKVDNTYFEAGS